MVITVGSKNKTKITAVEETLNLYPTLFPRPKILGIEVSVEEFGHPKTLDQTIQGAVDRAKQAYQNCDYSFGIEGGLMEVPYTKTGYMETGACAIYDGKNLYIGLGPAFEWPSAVTKRIISGEADASKAFKQLGYTKHEKLGAMPGGILGFLTNGKLTREDFTQYSIIMALTQLERVEIYS